MYPCLCVCLLTLQWVTEVGQPVPARETWQLIAPSGGRNQLKADTDAQAPVLFASRVDWIVPRLRGSLKLWYPVYSHLCCRVEYS